MPSRWRASITVVLAACLTALNPGLPGAMAAVSRTSVISTIAGNGTAGFSGDGGPASASRLNQPRDSAMGPDGSIYVADTFNNRIRRITPAGTITTVAGNGSATYNGDGIQATRASLSWPHDVTVDSTGVIFIADSQHHRIRRVGLNGVITTLAGTGVSGSTGEGGPATSARLKNPKTVALHNGALYTAGLDNKVRRIDLTTGIITTVAGTGVAGYAGDGGHAKAARLNGPQRLQIDSQGNIYVADTLNSVIRRVDGATGIIRTVAGVGGVTGFRGDNGPATSALLDNPRGLALEGDGTLYSADSDNNRVRAVDLTTGIITTVAGTQAGYSGDGGPAGSARLQQPRGLTVTTQGDLLVAEVGNSVIRKVAGTAT
jgi:trimeric autotransporter adhesin